jgi:pimeloyl-ACP methyl ester carboxylesterase
MGHPELHRVTVCIRVQTDRIACDHLPAWRRHERGNVVGAHMEWFAGFHCLAPDLPGHGRSNRLSWISRAETSRQIARLIESRTALGRAHVVGLSLDAAVAHELLAQEPNVLDHVSSTDVGHSPHGGSDS